MTGPEPSRTIRFRLHFPDGSAVPPGASVRVRVEDVSVADRSSQVIAEETLAVSGEEGLSIDVPLSKVDPRASYSISAHVTAGDAEQIAAGDFISPAIVPVLTAGASDEPEINLVRV